MTTPVPVVAARILVPVVAVIYLVLAATWIRRIRRKKELGAVLATARNGMSTWPGYLFVFIAATKGFEVVSELEKGRTAHGIIEGCFALLYGGMGLLYTRSSKGLRICEGGIDLGLLVFPWREIRSWNWSSDRTALEFWTDSPWRFMNHLLPSRPLRYKAEFSTEVDSVLAAVAPKDTRGQVA